MVLIPITEYSLPSSRFSTLDISFLPQLKKKICGQKKYTIFTSLKLHNSVALNTFMMLYNHHHHLSHNSPPRKTKTLCSLNNNAPLPFSPAPGNHHSLFCLYDFDNFRYLIQVESGSFCLLVSSLFHLAQCFQGSSMLYHVPKFHLFLWLNNNSTICVNTFVRSSVHRHLAFFLPLSMSNAAINTAV